MPELDKAKEVDMLQNFNAMWSGDELSLQVLLLNVAVGFVLSVLVMQHYRRYSSVLTNRNTVSRVFPFIILTTILVISIVKSSLALSLGLVGALSIVRFRTPIKEPEELAYLFLSIAIGLGLGANQTLNTIVAALIILALMALMKKKQDGSVVSKDYYLSIDIDNEEDHLPSIINTVSAHSLKTDLRRYQVSEGFSNIVLFVDIVDADNLHAITDELKQQYKGITVSFIDQSKMPTI